MSLPTRMKASMTQHNRILIVDDQPRNVALLEDILGDDYPLATASSGEEALIQAQSFRPALILLDIMMPGIDGYETCRQLRTMPTLRHTKIVMVSAKAMASERVNGYEAGADDYITKPFNLGELEAKVRVYLRLKSLEELDQLKSDVLDLLSHETATPLNGILGPLQYIQETVEMDAEQKECLDMIYASATRLQTLYSKVCTLSAMRAGNQTFTDELVNVADLVQAAIAASASHAPTQTVRFELTCPDEVITRLDWAHMQDVITALLHNAIRVSPPAGQVTIQVWLEEEHFYLTVTDQGPGIDPDFLPQVFEPFAQADISHHSKGQGLSLAIAQQVVEAHAGTIRVESVLGVGATFEVRVPVVTA